MKLRIEGEIKVQPKDHFKDIFDCFRVFMFTPFVASSKTWKHGCTLGQKNTIGFCQLFAFKNLTMYMTFVFNLNISYSIPSLLLFFT